MRLTPNSQARLVTMQKNNSSQPRFSMKRMALLMAGLLFMQTQASVFAAPARSTAPVAPVATDASVPAPADGQAGAAGGLPVPPPAPPVPTVTYSLQQLGAQYPLNITGVDGSDTLRFGVRDDQVVTGAQLNLRYAYSPALLPDISHINVLVNDQIAFSIPVPKKTGGQSLDQTFQLPPYLITSSNNLRLQLIGHYTMSCEDPQHTSLWVNISNHSTLALETQPLPLPNDLARLPEPFFDQHDGGRLDLPFVFVGNPSVDTLEAAGAVSSWFGSLAAGRGARFPASVDQMPTKGNGVVFSVGVPASMMLQDLQGPTLAVVTNPNDPNGKLLLVMGRNGQEIRQAADALVTGSETLTGRIATITHDVVLKPRQPYDAPRWLPTDRPVPLGELIDATQLNVSGFSPDIIRINSRVAPDLFGWHQPPVPLDLHYRYTPQSESVNSALLFSVNDQFVKSMPLLALERLEGGKKLSSEVLSDKSLPREAHLEIPLDLLKPRGQLQFRYMYDYIKQGECRDIIIDDVRGYIDPKSTIDLRGYQHYMAMPDLSAFSMAGFPFTRMADLSDTAVVLSNTPNARDYSTYLAIMGRMGESTGYPATGVTVVSVNQVDQAPADKDLLVIASGNNPTWLQSWAQKSPGGYGANGANFTLSDLPSRVLGWFHPDPRLNHVPSRAALAYVSSGVSAVIAGFESPLKSDRSVVMVASNQPEGLDTAVSALLNVRDGSQTPIQGSLVVVRGKEVDPVAAEHTYYIGHLDIFTHIDWWLSSISPSLTLSRVLWTLGTIILVILVIWGLRALLRRRRNGRLS